MRWVVQKKLIAFPHHTQKFEDSYHHLLHLTFLTAPIPILPDFDSVIHQQGVKKEYELLESAYDNKTSYWVPWAKRHAGKHQSFVRLPDISAILPPMPSYHMYTCGLSIVGADSLVRVNNIKRAWYCLQFGACLIYLTLKQLYRGSRSDELILLWLANKSKINEMYFYWKLNLWLMCLSSYDLFERANIHYILHRYVNSYAGTSLWTTTTMLDGSQFTYIICWFHLKTRRNYISFSWMDISTSKKLTVNFRLWD